MRPARAPCPHPGGLFIVWAPGRGPGPPDKGRAVISSGAAPGWVWWDRGEGGPDHSTRPGARACRRRSPAPRLPAPGSGPRFPGYPPKPPHRVRRGSGGAPRKATPPSAGSARAPGGSGRRAREAGWGGGGGRRAGLRRRRRVWSCFWTAFNSGGKNICLKVQKKGGVGEEGAGKKPSKAGLERMFAK